MGWQASKAVWTHSTTNGNAKLLMLAIAEHIDQSGRAWPSIARLADMVGVGERAVKQLLKQCETAGELVVERASGRGNTSQYRFTFFDPKGDRTITIADEEKGDRAITHSEEIKGDRGRIKGDPPCAKGDRACAKGDRAITLNNKESIEPIEPEEIDKKTAPRNKKNKASATIEIPAELNTPEFVAAWGEWVKYRGDSIKPLTYQSQLKRLAKEPPEFAIARLERAITSGWTGLWFPDEKPIVINGKTAAGVYVNGHAPGKRQAPTAVLDYLVDKNGDGRM